MWCYHCSPEKGAMAFQTIDCRNHNLFAVSVHTVDTLDSEVRRALECSVSIYDNSAQAARFVAKCG